MKIGAQSAGNGELKWSYFHVPTALSAKDASLAAEDARLATSTLQRLTVHIIIINIINMITIIIGHFNCNIHLDLVFSTSLLSSSHSMHLPVIGMHISLSQISYVIA